MPDTPLPDLQPTYHASGGPSSKAAWCDIREAFQRWPLWIMMAWQDTKLRYRGSLLGPFWLTMSMGVMILAMGFVYGHLLKTSANEYFPYLTLGLMQWNLLATLMQDACITFLNSNSFIKQIRLPYMIFVLRTITRALIVYAHNFIIYIIVALIFGIWPGVYIWLLIPGLFLLLINAIWVVLLLGMLCSRFRDITPLVGSLVQIAFFVTPVIWEPHLMSDHGWVVWLNPFYHFLEIMRAPLVGRAPEPISYAFVILTAAIGSLITFAMFRRYRARIAYWV